MGFERLILRSSTPSTGREPDEGRASRLPKDAVDAQVSTHLGDASHWKGRDPRRAVPDLVVSSPDDALRPD